MHTTPTLPQSPQEPTVSSPVAGGHPPPPTGVVPSHPREVASVPPSPSGVGRFARSAGRAVGRTLAVGLIAGAGYGGWIAYEEYLAPSVEGSWGYDPSESLFPGAPFVVGSGDASFVTWMTSVTGAVTTRETHVDASSGVAKMYLRGDNGDLQATVEVARGRAFTRLAGAENWDEVVAESLDLLGAQMPTRVAMPRVVDFFPTEIEPHLTVRPIDGGDVLRYVVDIDAAAFRTASPVLHRRWVNNTSFDERATISWVVDVDAQGNVTRLVGREDAVAENWSELTEPVVLESPLATLLTEAPSDDAAPDEPATVGLGPWNHATTTITSDGEWRATRFYDVTDGVIQDLAADGTPKLEMTRTAGYRVPDATWVPFAESDPELDAEGVATLYDGFAAQLVPPLLVEIVPSDVAYFTVVEETVFGEGRRIVVSLDRAGWNAADPEAFSAWMELHGSMVADVPEWVLVVDDNDGRLRALGEIAGGVEFTWEMRPGPIQLQSALLTD